MGNRYWLLGALFCMAAALVIYILVQQGPSSPPVKEPKQQGKKISFLPPSSPQKKEKGKKMARKDQPQTNNLSPAEKVVLQWVIEKDPKKKKKIRKKFKILPHIYSFSEKTRKLLMKMILEDGVPIEYQTLGIQILANETHEDSRNFLKKILLEDTNKKRLMTVISSLGYVRMEGDSIPPDSDLIKVCQQRAEKEKDIDLREMLYVNVGIKGGDVKNGDIEGWFQWLKKKFYQDKVLQKEILDAINYLPLPKTPAKLKRFLSFYVKVAMDPKISLKVREDAVRNLTKPFADTSNEAVTEEVIVWIGKEMGRIGKHCPKLKRVLEETNAAMGGDMRYAEGHR